MNVQAFLNNISFPKTLQELDFFADGFNVEEILTVDKTEWTAPKWTVCGDIVFFFHAKTAIQTIRRLEIQLKSQQGMKKEEYQRLWDSLQRARKLYKNYGGKIFAVGRVSKRAFYDSQEIDELFHWASRYYAPIDSICVLKEPIDIDEFSDFIFVSRQSAITPIVGNDFERLKAIIQSKNSVPDYLKESKAIPLPLQKINERNWLEVTKEYRRLFGLEIQFRKFYVDYLLRVLGTQKRFFAECECFRDGKRTGIADNVVKIGGKWCFVEVKLNVRAEHQLHDQLRKYCNVDYANLNEERKLLKRELLQENVIVIDTRACYCYDSQTDQLSWVNDLDKIKSEKDILELRNEILSKLKSKSASNSKVKEVEGGVDKLF